MRAAVLAGAALALLALPAAAQQGAGWTSFHGDLAAHQYSPADQITPQNVGKLEKAWEVHTGDMSDGSGDTPTTVWSATPIFANDTLYVGTPFYRIFALAPDTGKVKWVYDSHAKKVTPTQPALKNRGVAYWQAATPGDGPCQKRVYIGTMEGLLHAVDADTGKPCADFGNGGVLDINQFDTINHKWPLSILQPPTVYKDTLFIGWAGKDWDAEKAPPGEVFAVDVRNGELKWTFHAIPANLEPEFGTANVWTAMTVDTERGILYLPVSSPSPNFYGGDRLEKVPMATSVTALDAETGRVIWSRQLVHHDIWDYDTNVAPTLVDLHRDGKTIPALVQGTKQGILFVLNRVTGEPIFPIEEHEVPASDVKGEQAAPTQPFPSAPPPTNSDEWPGVFWLANAVSAGGCSRWADSLRYEGRYTPPSTQGTLVYPPTSGGMQWGGGTLDPDRGIFYINSSSIVQVYTLIPRDKYEKVAGGSGNENGYYPQTGVPYGFRLQDMVNWMGMPCWKPPYGTMTAYDLNKGTKLWQRPFGQVQKYGFYMPKA